MVTINAYMTYHRMCNKINTAGAMSGARTDYPSGSSVRSTGFSEVCVISSFFLSTVVLFIFLPLYCLSFYRCIVSLFTVVLFIFLPLYCLSFYRCIVYLYTVVLFIFLPLYCLSFYRCIVYLSIYGFWLSFWYLFFDFSFDIRSFKYSYDKPY